MIHPSYVDLMEVVNKNVEEGETPVINSRYSAFEMLQTFRFFTFFNIIYKNLFCCDCLSGAILT